MISSSSSAAAAVSSDNRQQIYYKNYSTNTMVSSTSNSSTSKTHHHHSWAGSTPLAVGGISVKSPLLLDQFFSLVDNTHRAKQIKINNHNAISYYDNYNINSSTVYTRLINTTTTGYQYSNATKKKNHMRNNSYRDNSSALEAPQAENATTDCSRVYRRIDASASVYNPANVQAAVSVSPTVITSATKKQRQPQCSRSLGNAHSLLLTESADIYWFDDKCDNVPAYSKATKESSVRQQVTSSKASNKRTSPAGALKSSFTSPKSTPSSALATTTTLPSPRRRTSFSPDSSLEQIHFTYARAEYPRGGNRKVLTLEDKIAIREWLVLFKTSEMEVHEESRKNFNLHNWERVQEHTLMTLARVRHLQYSAYLSVGPPCMA